MGSVSSDAGFSDAELSAAANSKPVYSWDQAARQITRNVEFDYLPKYPSALTLTYSYRATDAAPAIPTGARTWIGSGFNSTSNGFQKFTAAQIATLDAWIPLIEEVANVDLVDRLGDCGHGTSRRPRPLGPDPHAVIRPRGPANNRPPLLRRILPC